MKGRAEKVLCAECHTPVAEVQDGKLVIRAHHHGREHVTVLSIPAQAVDRDLEEFLRLARSIGAKAEA